MSGQSASIKPGSKRVKIALDPARPVLVTGASGRIGRLLRLVWPDLPQPDAPPVWIGRRATAPDMVPWDFNALPPIKWPEGAVVLHLAGVVAGDAAALEANVTLAQALAQAARARRAAHVIFASTVAVFRPAETALPDTTPPDPQSAYGRAKHRAEQALRQALSQAGIGLTILRIANVAGADALLGGAAARAGSEITLDPAPGRPFGPERSYIGPLTLARVLRTLTARTPDLPDVMNIAQPGRVAMGALLDAAGLAWRFGPPREGVIPRVEVATDALRALLPLEPATPQDIVAELSSLTGRWP